MDIHDEFERSVGARRSKLSPLAWIGIGLAGFGVVVLGVFIAAGIAITRSAQDIAERMRDAPVNTIAETLERYAGFEVVESSADGGSVVMRDRSGQTRTLSVDEAVDGKLNFTTDDGTFTLDFQGDDGEGRLVLTRDGEEMVSVDASGRDGSGSLVIRSGDDVFRLDASGGDDGGRLVVQTQDGEVLRLDAQGNGDTGWLRVGTGEGEMFRMNFEGDGDVVTIETDRGRTTFRGFDEGGSTPRWVPDYYDMDEGPKVFTADVDEGSAGAYRFSTDDGLERVLDHFRDSLGDDGFDLKDQEIEFKDRLLQALLMGERDERAVSVMLLRTPGDSQTKGFVTWWER